MQRQDSVLIINIITDEDAGHLHENINCVTIRIYCNLAKECPQAEHLTSLPKRGVGNLLSVSTFNHKECPCHVYSGWMPSKQLIGLTVTYNRPTSVFES